MLCYNTFHSNPLMLIFGIDVCSDAALHILKDLRVPEYSFIGGTADLECDFDLGSVQLYSLKWYHNKTEFYRYVPTERERPINIKPTNNFVFHVSIPFATPFSGDFGLHEAFRRYEPASKIRKPFLKALKTLGGVFTFVKKIFDF